MFFQEAGYGVASESISVAGIYFLHATLMEKLRMSSNAAPANHLCMECFGFISIIAY